MSDLINSLINSFFVGEDSEIRDLKYKLLSHEYKLELERAGFDLNKIYKTKDGRWKVSSPIQICRSNKDDCLKILYEHFYGKFEKTLNNVYKLWVKSFENLAQQGHRSSITLDGYTGYYRKYISTSSLENMPISKIKPITLYNFYAECAALGKMTRKSLNNLKSLINHIFDYAVLNEYSQTNPAKLVNTKDLILADQDNSKKVYSKEDRLKLMGVFKENRHDPYANALTVLFCTGMRSGEIRALKREDIDFGKKSIFVHREMVRRKNSEGKMVQICLNHTKAKKEGGNRVIPITRDALEALRRQMEINPDGEFVFMIDEHVFHQNSLNVALKKYCKEADVNYLSCHKMRFWTVTAMYAAGIPQAIIQRSVGHLSPATTDHYKRISKLGSISLPDAEAICNTKERNPFVKCIREFFKRIGKKQAVNCAFS